MGFTTRKRAITTLANKSTGKGQKAFLTFSGSFCCGASKRHSRPIAVVIISTIVLAPFSSGFGLLRQAFLRPHISPGIR